MNSIKENQNKEEFGSVILAVIIVMGFVFLVSFFVFYIKDRHGVSESCGCQIPIYLVLAILSSLGVFVGCTTYYLLSKQYKKEHKKNIESTKKTLDFLPFDEKRTISIIIESEGKSTQSFLVSKTGYTKVKISRIITRLEAKGILEKHKNGMTNIVSLNEDLKKVFV